MGMGSLLKTILWTILNYKRDPYVTVRDPSIRLRLTAAHICLINHPITPASIAFSFFFFRLILHYWENIRIFLPTIGHISTLL